jgi:hypothetical protein
VHNSTGGSLILPVNTDILGLKPMGTDSALSSSSGGGGFVSGNHGKWRDHRYIINLFCFVHLQIGRQTCYPVIIRRQVRWVWPAVVVKVVPTVTKVVENGKFDCWKTGTTPTGLVVYEIGCVPEKPPRSVDERKRNTSSASRIELPYLKIRIRRWLKNWKRWKNFTVAKRKPTDRFHMRVSVLYTYLPMYILGSTTANYLCCFILIISEYPTYVWASRYVSIIDHLSNHGAQFALCWTNVCLYAVISLRNYFLYL